jgi:hypothetical protein
LVLPPSLSGMRRTALVFLRTFLIDSASGERVERQQRQPVVGDVRQPTEGTADEVPVPRRISSRSGMGAMMKATRRRRRDERRSPLYHRPAPPLIPRATSPSSQQLSSTRSRALARGVELARPMSIPTSQSHIQWRATEWILAFGPLNPSIVMDYFVLSPFYDRASTNAQWRMQMMFSGGGVGIEEVELR